VVLNEDGTTTVKPLDNDTDVDGPPLTVVVEDGPDHGTLTPGAGGTSTYAPDPNFCGTDSFTYHATDGTLSSASTTVSITVNCVNDTPQVVADPPVIGNEDTGIPSNPTANDTDVEGDDLHPVITTQGQHGHAVVNPDDTITYTPNPNYCGTDTYGYKVTDGVAQSPEVMVTVTITCVNDAPVAGDDAPVAGTNKYRTDQGGPPLTVAAPGVLSNDTDVEGDALTASVVTGPTHGTLVMQPNGSFTYTPAAGYYGLDSFTYQVSDGHGGTDTGLVTIRVRGITKMTAQPVILKFSPSLKLYVGTFQAKLTDNTGAPVAGKSVVFLLGGGTQAACTATTDASGVATCTATLLNLVLAILGPPQAVFAGDDTMIGSSDKSTLLLL
jgi:VCBS repeat-containing protein